VRRWLPAYVNEDPVLMADKLGKVVASACMAALSRRPAAAIACYYAAGGSVAVAFSDDGLAWRKPELDICRLEGKLSNIVLQGLT